jgi:dethiobiotin synthetase
MKKLVIASISHGAGKTSFTIGLAKASGKKFAYLKPLGDRLLYKKKRQWDFDAAVVTSLCGLAEGPENMTIGFEHSKLRYMYDEEGLKEKLGEAISAVQEGCDLMVFEAGPTLSYGLSVNMDALSLTGYVDGKLIAVVSGVDDVIVDDITFLKRYLEGSQVDFAGVVINKVRDKSDFMDVHMESIKELGVNVLGIIPFHEELTRLKVSYLTDKLFAKVIAGEQGLEKNVKHVVVGAILR